MTNIEPSFSTFYPKAYLHTYYKDIGCENSSLLKFYSHAYDNVDFNSLLLEFSGGPTIYSLITASAHVKEIHFSDFLEANLKEIRSWLHRSPYAFDWSEYVKKALEYEGSEKITDEDVADRIELIRKKITKIMKCNAFSYSPLENSHYDIINMNFVAESITSSVEEWRRTLSNVLSLLKEEGTFIMTAIKGANYYKVGNKLFPAVALDEEDVINFLLDAGFKKKDIVLESIKAEKPSSSDDTFVGYTGMIFTKARRA